MMNARLLTDTCAALKLLIFGEALFQKGTLPSGDLILHPRVFNETSRWAPNRKLQFKVELETMAKIRATTDLRPPPSEFRINDTIIKSARNTLGLSVGTADIEQLNTAMHYDLKLVTSDQAFAKLAIELEVGVLSAEEILIEATTCGMITVNEAKAALKHPNWSIPSTERGRLKKANLFP